MKITWSDRAVADLSEIRSYISEDTEAHAISLLERLIGAVENLQLFPDRGRRVPEAPEVPNLRELLVGNYRLLYRRQAERVEVVMVIHGRRHLAGIEPKPW